MITLHCRPAGEAPSEIRIGQDIVRSVPQWCGSRRAFAVVDAAVVGAVPFVTSWPHHVAAGGEAHKTLAACETVLRAMVRAGLDRESLLVAIGGGAVGDAAGLCASLFLRGIELWQVPTTLLAMVDSAVGGKTAANLPEGKNLVGTVHPASLVVIDVDFVRTLPEPQFHSGLAEAVKMAIGLDAELFALLEREREAVLRRDPEAVTEVVRRSIAAKIAVVEGDPREHGRRRLLNLGHTLGHALEARSNGQRAHGLCVARGLHFALDLAKDLGALAAADRDRCTALLRAYGFERDALPPRAELVPFLARDKKVVGSTVHFALPTGIGQSRVEPIELQRLVQRLEN
ncbi:MAG: 3-dehydroquinate synthase family protein [Planctomycetota bacterium]|nr:3-dehydroquinate synthase family protein [Planctomycetota bacterium]